MEGLEIYTVELYLKVRLACADGMSKRAAARHFNISRAARQSGCDGVLPHKRMFLKV